MKKDSFTYIEDILKKEESTTLEFKANFDKEVAAKVICSFLNRDGGQLIIGLSEDKKAMGIQDIENKGKELQSYLINSIVPEPAISVDTQSINNKDVLVVSVWQGTNQPYIYNGAVYFRKGATTIQANSKQLADLIHKDALRNQRWKLNLLLK
ncbi:AlbA family DNA-binding domain-containing protein [Nonlabens tegetincola]|uniref:AlbA family DNA-binding domain-containing protein n=1 Tax=Nonlabens tegetincola TaxID=323273 RepID=UPI000CF46517|nr:ATP-binding protein [Nonlabens tegetincola]PQJ17028.1 hypothetical protein BST93_10165 [Nonlabens tegetincola]